MKKILLTFCAAALLLSLAACGGTETEEAPNMEPLAPTVTEVPASDADAMKEAPAEAEAAPDDASESDAGEITEAASETDAVDSYDPALLQAAQDCVGASVEALYNAIGEPIEAQYAASCLEENAEDGMLFYDGFYVWTVRNADGETVHEVYLSD